MTEPMDPEDRPDPPLQGDERATLNGQPVDPNGSAMAEPTGPTTFTLVVENEIGRAESSVQVRLR